MDCVRAQQLVKPYLDGYLSDRELEEFLDHVETCGHCFDELEIYYSIYRTLDNVDEKGNYDFTVKLRKKLAGSRGYLRRRYRIKAFKTAVIAGGEFAAMLSLWGMFMRMAG